MEILLSFLILHSLPYKGISFFQGFLKECVLYFKNVAEFQK